MHRRLVKPVTLKFKAIQVRSMDYPLKSGVKNIYFYVFLSDLPDIPGQFTEVNPRDPKLGASTSKKIKHALYNKSDLFGLMNRGLLIPAQSFEFDNKTSMVTIVLKDTKSDGVGDGLHTLSVLMNEKESLLAADHETVVKFEVITGLQPDDVSDVVEARNTSRQVQDYSMMNQRNLFDPLKKALSSAPFFDRIAWHENESDAEGKTKRTTVGDVISLITPFNPLVLTKNHPIFIYSSTKKVLDMFHADVEGDNTYAKVYPLAPSILKLYDHIRKGFLAAYQRYRRQDFQGAKPKFNNLPWWVSNEYLPFLDESLKLCPPDGMVLPILSAFRSFIVEDRATGNFKWRRGVKPMDLFDGDMGRDLVGIVVNRYNETESVNKIGKDSAIWELCFRTAQDYIPGRERVVVDQE